MTVKEMYEQHLYMGIEEERAKKDVEWTMKYYKINWEDTVPETEEEENK